MHRVVGFNRLSSLKPGTSLAADPGVLFEPPTKILLDFVCGEVSQLPLAKGLLKMTERPHVSLASWVLAARIGGLE